MKTIKMNGANANTIRNAFEQLKKANEMESEARKLKNSGKAVIGAILKEERDIDIDSLAIGEIINIDTIGLIEIGKQNRFDSATFQLAKPELFAAFMKEFPVTKFKSLA